MRLPLTTKTCALIIATTASAQSPGVGGHWPGTMEREGAAMTVRFDFQTGPQGVAGRFTLRGDQRGRGGVFACCGTGPRQ